jgi:hypothetical protein
MMWGIIKKDVLYFAGYFLLTAWAPVNLLILDGMDDGLVLFLGIMPLMTAVSALGVIEMLEEKSKGYFFLATLPITAGEIIRAKFSLIFSFVLLWVALAFVMISYGAPYAAFAQLSRAFILCCATACLGLVGLLYILTFRFGLTRLIKIFAFVFPPAIIMGPAILLPMFREERMAFDPASLAGTASTLNLVILAVFGVGLFTGLMAAAIRVKRAADAN